MDDEMAQRLQTSNTNRRRHSSYLAKKHAARRGRGGRSAAKGPEC